MPVILRFGKFKYIIYPKDHRPAHVHVIADEAEAKFNIKTAECIAVYGFSQKTVNRLKEVLISNRDLLLEAWNEQEGEE